MHQWRPSMDMDGGCGFFEVSESSGLAPEEDSSRIPSWISVDSNRSSTSGPSYLSEASSRSSIDDEELLFEIRAEESLKKERLQAAADLAASAEYHMLVNEFTSGFGSLSLDDDFLPPPEAPKSLQNQVPDPSYHQAQQPPRHEQSRNLQTNSQPPAPRSQPKEQPAQSHLSDNLPRIELPLGFDAKENGVHHARGFSGRTSRRRAPPQAINPPMVAPPPMIRSAVDMPVTHSAFDSDSDDDDLDSSGKLREFKTWLANEASPLRNYYHENLEGRYRSPGSFVPSSVAPHMVADKLIGTARGAVSKAKAKGFQRSSRKESPMQIEFIGGGRVI
ncbi:unnamed protein product [Clonostachys byssicola]|uniref:Uncharacterized protein n=1 Tax=Clonostachys byssicola TaxID=160290 RepID=A0A9N9U0R7_9HYPO|nr:unnamed protein product [Clonostachys byssicola]